MRCMLQLSVWLWWLLFLTQNKIYMVINNKNGSCLFMVYLISSFIGISAYGQDYTLMILVKNVRNDKGVLRVTLFKQKGDYMENFSTNKVVQAKTGGVTATFDRLQAGEYAVTVMHDENNNNKLDSNFIRIPK